MKKLIVSMAFAIGTLAGVSNANAEYTPHQACSQLAEVSYQLVIMRQSGVSRERAEEILFEAAPMASVRQAVLHLIDAAYNYPMLHSEVAINQLAGEFKVEIYDGCMRIAGSTL